MPNGRRFTNRAPAFKAAKLVTPQFARDCIVRDISTTGARVTLISTADVPDRFDLTFGAARTKRACRVVWRTTVELGVQF